MIFGGNSAGSAFLRESPADETAAADGNLRLDDMVTGAIRIDVRIEEDEDTHLLVAVQDKEPDEQEKTTTNARKARFTSCILSPEI